MIIMRIDRGQGQGLKCGGHSLLIEAGSELPCCTSRVLDDKRKWEWCRLEASDSYSLNKKGMSGNSKSIIYSS